MSVSSRSAFSRSRQFEPSENSTSMGSLRMVGLKARRSPSAIAVAISLSSQEQGVFRVLVEIGQPGVALVAGDADDEAGEAAVDIECLLAGHRMGAPHRVFGARIFALVGDAVIGVEPAIGLLAVVQRGEPVEI